MKTEFEIDVINGEIMVGETALKVMKEAKRIKEEQTRNDIEMKAFRDSLLKAMEDHGIKKFENDIIKVTYKAPYTKRSLDTKAMKEQLPDLYESFLKESDCKSSINLTFKD